MIELVGTENGTRAHYIGRRNLKRRRHRAGRRGSALCGVREVFDQAAIDEQTPLWRGRKVLADLPVCARCQRIRAELEQGTATKATPLAPRLLDTLRAVRAGHVVYSHHPRLGWGSRRTDVEGHRVGPDMHWLVRRGLVLPLNTAWPEEQPYTYQLTEAGEAVFTNEETA